MLFIVNLLPTATPATLYHGNKRQMDPLRTHARCCKPPLAITQTHPFLAGATEVKNLPPPPLRHPKKSLFIITKRGKN